MIPGTSFPLRHRRLSAVLLLVLAGVASVGVLAHQMSQVEANLVDSERYAQLVNRPAPGFNLRDASGRPVALTDFRGKVVVLNFIYARCHDTCPLHSSLVARIQARISEADGLDQQIHFLTVSTDTEDATETAALMAAHGKTYGLAPSNWTFLHGGVGRERGGLELAKAYGLEFTPTGSGKQVHGVVTHVIDPDGQLRARFHGLEFAPIQLMLYAAALAHGEHTPGFGAEGAVAPAWSSRLVFSAAIAVLGMAIYALWLLRSRRRATRALAAPEEPLQP